MKRIGIFFVTLVLLLGSFPFPTAVYAAPRFPLNKYNYSKFAANTTYPEIPPYANALSVNPSTAIDETPSKATPLFKWQPSMIADKTISKREEGLDMKGVVPELTEAFGPTRDALNEHINNAVTAKVSAAKEIKARSITFDYDYIVYGSDSLVSVIILSTVLSASSKKEVVTVNFEPSTGKIVSLSEVLGVNILPLAEKFISEKIRRNPEKYNTAFDDELPETQAFFLEDDRIVLLFNEFLLLSGAGDYGKIEMELSKIVDVTIGKAEYYVKPGYDLKMVPLRVVCEGVGYEVLWFNDEQRAEINRDGVPVMDLTLGENNYVVRDKKVRSLESAPELASGSVYVPISFFDQILSLITYSIDTHDNITFTAYIASE